MAILEISAENFDTMAGKDTPYAVVDCYGSFCSACVMLEPVLEAAANDMAGIYFLKVNLDENPEIAERFEIDAMPTLLFFRNGRLAAGVIGSMDRETLNGHLAGLLYGKDE